MRPGRPGLGDRAPGGRGAYAQDEFREVDWLGEAVVGAGGGTAHPVRVSGGAFTVTGACDVGTVGGLSVERTLVGLALSAGTAVCARSGTRGWPVRPHGQ